MLIDRVKECSSSFRELRNIRETATSFGQFERNVDSLQAFSRKVNAFISTTNAIEQSQFDIPVLMTKEQRDNLSSVVSDAGMACKELRLDNSHINALNAAIENYITMLNFAWKSNISGEVDDLKSYLSVIMQLLENRSEATNLIRMLDADKDANPSSASVNRMELNIRKAHEITDNFQLTPEVKLFLEKVKSRNATFADLTPAVMDWITVNHLKSKLKIGF